MKARTLIVLFAVAFPLALLAANYPSDLVFYSNFNSEFDVVSLSQPGVHTVVWNATADGVKVGSSAMVTTVSLVVPEE